jgi:hypothetical protein
MTLLLIYWTFSTLITHAAFKGHLEADNLVDNGFIEHSETLLIAIIFGPFYAPFIIHTAFRFVFEYIDRNEI